MPAISAHTTGLCKSGSPFDETQIALNGLGRFFCLGQLSAQVGDQALLLLAAHSLDSFCQIAQQVEQGLQIVHVRLDVPFLPAQLVAI